MPLPNGWLVRPDHSEHPAAPPGTPSGLCWGARTDEGRVGAAVEGVKLGKMRQGLLAALFSTGCTSRSSPSSSLAGGGEEEHPQVTCGCSYVEAACPYPRVHRQEVHPCCRFKRRAQHEARAMMAGRIWPASAIEAEPSLECLSAPARPAWSGARASVTDRGDRFAAWHEAR